MFCNRLKMLFYNIKTFTQAFYCFLIILSHNSSIDFFCELLTVSGMKDFISKQGKWCAFTVPFVLDKLNESEGRILTSFARIGDIDPC